MPITPNLLLLTNIKDDYQENDYWYEDDNTSDPYLGRAFRWQLNLEIQTQFHSDHTTMNPYQYNGTDLVPDFWIASGIEGRAVKIIEVVSAQFDSATVIVEDVERWNIFTDPYGSGSGLINPGPGVIFKIGSDGLPLMGPIPDEYLQPKAVEDLMARFMARNGVRDFVLVNQEFHGFFPGDVIYADFENDIGYKKVDRANLQKAIGIVTEINAPGLDYFSYRPMGRLINNVNPPLWGAHGDVFYMDPNEPGALTNEKPEGVAIPVYLQLDLPTRAIMLERGVEVETAASETNKYDVENVTAGQTTFTLPRDCREVLYMAINGIENENYTFSKLTKVLEFDPVETGYGVDVDDEVFFVYKS